MTDHNHGVPAGGLFGQIGSRPFHERRNRLRASAAVTFPPLLVGLLLSLWALLWSPLLHAAQDRYEYDPLGRLITHIDTAGQATQYRYDAAGNILSVTRRSASELQRPQVTGVSPSVLRRGQTRQIAITGTELQNVAVQSPTPELLLGNVQRTATRITLDLTATQNAPQGPHVLTLSNLRGSAQATVSIAPNLPTLAVEPSPLALPPTGAQYSVTLRLSNVDLEPHTIALSSSDPTRLTVNTASVQVPAGQTSATFNVAGVASGFASLNLSSATLAPLSVPVFITADFSGVNTSRAQPVGLMVGEITTPVMQTAGTFASPLVGLSLGGVITDITPSALSLGDVATLDIAGHHLPEGAQVIITPADGLTLGAFNLSPDRTRLQLPLTVSADAALGLRRLTVLGADGLPVPMADAALGQLRIGAGLPVVHSVDPIFGVPGTTIELTVRGQRLQDGVISFQPVQDLIVETPSVNADGTVLTARVQVAGFAATGVRTLRVTTPNGASPEQATAANQFTVVQQIRESITPISAALVGVQVGSSAVEPQPQAVGPVVSPPVGLAVGAYGRAAEPAVGVIATTTPVLIRGQGLGAVASVAAASADDGAGLTFGALTASADGSELRFTVSVAADAPRSLRRLRLLTAQGTELPLIDPRFTVSAPLPALLSVTPQVVQAGQTVALRVRGQRLEGASAVRLLPADGVSLSAPVAVAGTDPDSEFSVSLQIAPTASLGERVLVVTTAAGESSEQPSPANSFRLVQQTGATLDAIAAPLVGVQVGQGGAGPSSLDYLSLSPVVGVMVQTAPAEPVSTSGPFLSSPVGVAVGAVVTAHNPEQPDGFLKGSQGVLVVDGLRLQSVDQIRIDAKPASAAADAVQFGQPALNAEGTRLQVPVTIASNAASGGYRVQLSAQGQPVAVLWQAIGFAVGALPERIDSVSHIVLQPGQAYPVTVRGAGFGDVYQVVIDGGTGIEVVPGTVVVGSDAFGEYVLVQLRVVPGAALGSRVLRLQVPGGLTPATPTPANTLTVIPE